MRASHSRRGCCRCETLKGARLRVNAALFQEPQQSALGLAITFASVRKPFPREFAGNLHGSFGEIISVVADIVRQVVKLNAPPVVTEFVHLLRGQFLWRFWVWPVRAWSSIRARRHRDPWARKRLK